MRRRPCEGNLRGTLPSHEAKNEDEHGARAHGERKQGAAPAGRRQQHHGGADLDCLRETAQKQVARLAVRVLAIRGTAWTATFGGLSTFKARESHLPSAVSAARHILAPDPRSCCEIALGGCSALCGPPARLTARRLTSHKPLQWPCPFACRQSQRRDEASTCSRMAQGHGTPGLCHPMGYRPAVTAHPRDAATLRQLPVSRLCTAGERHAGDAFCMLECRSRLRYASWLRKVASLT